jgi:hypothetical protein
MGKEDPEVGVGAQASGTPNIFGHLSELTTGQRRGVKEEQKNQRGGSDLSILHFRSVSWCGL